jgi:hypothetical protein
MGKYLGGRVEKFLKKSRHLSLAFDFWKKELPIKIKTLCADEIFFY